jgi:hypothetical protein
MMILGIVTYDHDVFAFLSASLLKEFDKVLEGLPVKSIGLPCINKRAIAQARRSEISHALSPWVVQYYGIPVFRRHPHAAP